MRLVIGTVVGLVFTLMSPAQAASPALSLDMKLMAMDKEQRVEYAIATVTTNKKQARCAKKIAYKESRYNTSSVNKRSGARGVWQLMWGKPHWSIFKQAQEANDYVVYRYGSWCKAYAFHQERNWF